ncbi:toll/interleukin-1 receptor domain-containing protein (plasmid) [Bosea vestrisii]|uniref:toll/interleukin-1 receptor domain-containing protein n=1 Tax=Bosea vestrisii TaxID=151416 RepID=UPI0024DFD1DA|nr:toll/interleukin-1 receptor domain-containing protein [Bosea vestrisii]WID99691.1 toll/interleukin-1 receptor domain-containing protein [Bosea vestrisii]
MSDFFISYTGVDRQWAEWIAFVLEEEGFTTILQAWDFRPGSNFVLEMQKASEAAQRTIMVLTADYLKSGMAAPEWASAFGRDPQGLERRLLPITARACEPQGLLKTIVQVRIVGMDEANAREAILAGANRARAKPSNRPAFPGSASPAAHKAFPGPDTVSRQPIRPLLPKLKVPLTDVDQRRFAKSAFGTIRTIFGANLEQVARENDRVEFDVTDTTAADFRAELFLDGASKGACRIWLGGMMGDNNICFAEGRISGNGCNEILMPATADNELSLSATMAMGYLDFERRTDMKKLTPEQAADYLWERFTRAFRSG